MCRICSLSWFIPMLVIISCQDAADNYVKIEPAHLEHVDGTDLHELTLTEKAVERLDIRTSEVNLELIEHSEARERLIVPYSSIIYDSHGHVWVYTNPEPLTYVRHEVKVDFIEGNIAVLHDGPPVGTKVVTVGAAELYGTEYEVGH